MTNYSIWWTLNKRVYWEIVRLSAMILFLIRSIPVRIEVIVLLQVRFLRISTFPTLTHFITSSVMFRLKMVFSIRNKTKTHQQKWWRHFFFSSSFWWCFVWIWRETLAAVELGECGKIIDRERERKKERKPMADINEVQRNIVYYYVRAEVKKLKRSLDCVASSCSARV